MLKKEKKHVRKINRKDRKKTNKIIHASEITKVIKNYISHHSQKIHKKRTLASINKRSTRIIRRDLDLLKIISFGMRTRHEAIFYIERGTQTFILYSARYERISYVKL